MGAVTVNGASLAYQEAGEGRPTFVFLHGWVCNRSFWEPQFANLSRDHRSIAFDLRGCGESKGPAPFDALQAADDIAAAIRALDAAPAIVVGHSLGGIVALLLNERHPGVVLGSLLGDPPLALAPNFGRSVAAIQERGSAAVNEFVGGLCSGVQPPELAAQIAAVMMSATPEVAAGMLDRSGEYAPRLDDLIRLADQKPLMAIWPSKPLGNPSHLRDIAVFIRQEPMPGASHFFQLERPDITNALLRAFLDDAERDPRIASMR